MRAGFDLGLDYLLMPLYAASFFLSGVIVAESFTPGRSPLRRYVLMAAMVAPVGALLDAVENALQIAMLLYGPTDASGAHRLQRLQCQDGGGHGRRGASDRRGRGQARHAQSQGAAGYRALKSRIESLHPIQGLTGKRLSV